MDIPKWLIQIIVILATAGFIGMIIYFLIVLPYQKSRERKRKHKHNI